LKLNTVTDIFGQTPPAITVTAVLIFPSHHSGATPMGKEQKSNKMDKKKALLTPKEKKAAKKEKKASKDHKGLLD
jgi:hypothetical protein